jgi:hypothetical protein
VRPGIASNGTFGVWPSNPVAVQDLHGGDARRAARFAEARQALVQRPARAAGGTRRAGQHPLKGR